MYVVNKIGTIVEHFIKINSKAFKNDPVKFEKVLSKLRKGGESNA